MSLVADTITPRSTKGTSIKFTDSTTYLNATTKLSLDQGLVKGYCTEYDQANDAVERTFNISSTSDQRTGVVNFFHTNSYRAKRGYFCMPNDARYGIISVESQDVEPSNCHSNEFNSDGSSNSIDDGNHQCTFFGELA